MRRVFELLTARRILALLAGPILGVGMATATASISTPVVHAQEMETTAALNCHGWQSYWNGVQVRTGPGTGYASIGSIRSGQVLTGYRLSNGDCKVTPGGRYSACGGSNLWADVQFHGRHAYIAAACAHKVR